MSSATNQKVVGFLAVQNDFVSLGKALPPTYLGGECPRTYCKSTQARKEVWSSTGSDITSDRHVILAHEIYETVTGVQTMVDVSSIDS